MKHKSIATMLFSIIVAVAAIFSILFVTQAPINSHHGSESEHHEEDDHKDEKEHKEEKH